MLAPLLMSVALAAAEPPLPACTLPQLEPDASHGDFRQELQPDGTLLVQVPLNEGGASSAVPDSAPPAQPRAEGTRWLWSAPSGWLLVPAEFVVEGAAVGADGSWVVSLHDPAATRVRRLRASGTGACVGCALGAAGAWFEAQAELARANEFLHCEGFAVPVERLQDTPQRLQVRYRDAAGRQRDAVLRVAEEGYNDYRELVLGGIAEPRRQALLDAY